MKRFKIAPVLLGQVLTDEMAKEFIRETAPSGWRKIGTAADGAAYSGPHGLKMIFSVAYEDDGKRWAHLSISKAASLPTWDELNAARDAFLGPEALCFQVLAAKSKHINIHPFCLHLWHCLDGDPLPDFARGGQSI